MANHAYLIANAGRNTVTVNAQSIAANRARRLVIDDTTSDLSNFVAGGCAITSAEVSDALSPVAQYAENAARLLAMNVRALASAGTDARGQAGI